MNMTQRISVPLTKKSKRLLDLVTDGVQAEGHPNKALVSKSVRAGEALEIGLVVLGHLLADEPLPAMLEPVAAKLWVRGQPKPTDNNLEARFALLQTGDSEGTTIAVPLERVAEAAVAVEAALEQGEEEGAELERAAPAEGGSSYGLVPASAMVPAPAMRDLAEEALEQERQPTANGQVADADLTCEHGVRFDAAIPCAICDPFA